MEPLILRGEPIKAARLLGYGAGDGAGDGYGDENGAGDGYGDENGAGDGAGDGYGSGYGYGDEDGYGYGAGDGYGYGYENGYGYGYEDGYGSGAGYGYGSGAGSGAGYGSKEYWLATVDAFASKWPYALRKRLGELKDDGATIAFWRSNCAGLPANGGERIDPAAPGVIHTSSGPLSICNRGTLHATLLPPKWKGERWWIVALTGDVIGDEKKYGALTREIIGEAF